MKILLHMCCGPCSITVLQTMLEQGHDVTGLFFNPNIHPLSEYLRRREGAVAVAEKCGIEIIMADTLPEADQQWADRGQALPHLPAHHDPAPASTPQHLEFLALPPAVNPQLWLKTVGSNTAERCTKCWAIRLGKTAQLARTWGFTAFSSTLLYSRYQNHSVLKEIGEKLATHHDLGFAYEDFRQGWQKGIDLSKEWGIYRQGYCGCIFSEYERYQKNWKRASGYKPPTSS